MKATIIDDSFGVIDDPELLKMSAVYVIIANEPENWFKNIRKIPIPKPFLAGFVTEIVKNNLNPFNLH